VTEEVNFYLDRVGRLELFKHDSLLKSLAQQWILESMKRKYLYNFDWLGRPIIQYPQDMVAIQEIIWQVRPTLIIETGIAHGGSLILSASMLALLDYCEAVECSTLINPSDSRRKVVGIDIEIREHNRAAIEVHPMGSKIEMIEGSSTDQGVVNKVAQIAKDHSSVMVLLDSNHTHEHVLGELDAYANLVSVGSYCVVFDTFVEDMPPGYFADRPWDKGNSPRTAVVEFLKDHSEFVVDESIQNKLLITVAPGGFLKRTS
jgi:cephalosporin hydroxylase